jgi:NADH-quinone oxidoreductase subunit J
LIAGVLFYAFAAVLVAAALGVITSRNPVHAALFLVLAFVQSAVLWLLIDAEFLALALVLVYVGAVMVLFLFVVMMLDVNVEELRKGFTRYLPAGIAVALIVVVEIGHVVWFKSQGLAFLTAPQSMPADHSNTKELGAVLYTEYVYAFEIASMILLLAIVAAITLTMRKRPGLKLQDIVKQVAVRREDRVRIVKVEPSKEP